MHFFKKLFGAVSNSKGKNDYALATLEYATSHRTYNNNALTSGGQVLAFRADSDYDRPVSNYTPAPQTNANNTINIMNIAVPGLKQKQTITITSFKSYSSKTDLFIHRS
jgi:hypothetical protein